MIVTADRIAAAIEDAPRWALLGLAVPSARLRDDARQELAQHVVARLAGSGHDGDRDQLALPLA